MFDISSTLFKLICGHQLYLQGRYHFQIERCVTFFTFPTIIQVTKASIGRSRLRKSKKKKWFLNVEDPNRANWIGGNRGKGERIFVSTEEEEARARGSAHFRSKTFGRYSSTVDRRINFDPSAEFPRRDDRAYHCFIVIPLLPNNFKSRDIFIIYVSCLLGWVK